MIPKNITREHVLAAIAEIDRAGTPDRRASRKFTLHYNGRAYPPKYVVALANKHANGAELSCSVFNGGAETNDFLNLLKFSIAGPSAQNGGSPPVQQAVQNPGAPKVAGSMPVAPVVEQVQPPGIPCPSAPAPSSVPATALPQTGKPVAHTNERCKECKRVVKASLERIYGAVQENWRAEVGTRPDDYVKTPCHAIRSRIYTALLQHRGFTEFVRATALPSSDFFAPAARQLFEFDESQHFTNARRLTLQCYPDGATTGFSKTQWMDLCNVIQAHDNDKDTPFRDEQRAWYDTLRDFLPQTKGLEPTSRVYSNAMRWCALNPEDAHDVALFKSHIETSLNPGCWVGTVLLEQRGQHSNNQRLDLLCRVVDKVLEYRASEGVILFSAGWFNAGDEEPRTLYEWAARRIIHLLRQKGRRTVVCVGVDGRLHFARFPPLRNSGFSQDFRGLGLSSWLAEPLETAIIAWSSRFPRRFPPSSMRKSRKVQWKRQLRPNSVGNYPS